MPFEIKKISNYGTQHPVVARLTVQTHELVQWAELPETEKLTIKSIYFEMAQRLLKCFEVYERLNAALQTAVEEVPPSVDSRIMPVPHLIGLRGEVETFLYEVKNYLRDLLQILNIFFSTKFKEASVLYDPKGQSKSALVDWAIKQFGFGDPFTRMLVDEQQWVGELIRKRNAVEHPGGKSGVLHIENFKLSPDGVVFPYWHRDQNNPSGLFPDLETYLDNLLTLAEDMLVSCIHHRTKFKIIQFVEIPLAERNLQCPLRLRVVLNQSMLRAPTQPAVPA